MPDCDARIRPFMGDTEIRCERDDEHAEHRGTLRDYAYAGSATTIDWQDNDRRTFRGNWPGRCNIGACVLPLGHGGNHAT